MGRTSKPRWRCSESCSSYVDQVSGGQRRFGTLCAVTGRPAKTDKIDAVSHNNFGEAIIRRHAHRRSCSIELLRRYAEAAALRDVRDGKELSSAAGYALGEKDKNQLLWSSALASKLRVRRRA